MIRPATPEGPTRCATCAAPLPAGAGRCEHCGSRPAPVVPAAAPPRRRRKLALAAAAALPVLALLTWGAVALQAGYKARLLRDGVQEGAAACRALALEQGLETQTASQLCNNLTVYALESIDRAVADEDEAPRRVKLLRGTIGTRGAGHWRELGAHEVAMRMNCNVFRASFHSDAQCKAFSDKLTERLALPGFEAER